MFAPELKTPVAVSGKRIADQIGQLTVKAR